MKKENARLPVNVQAILKAGESQIATGGLIN
jgi:hypothetical protein